MDEKFLHDGEGSVLRRELLRYAIRRRWRLRLEISRRDMFAAPRFLQSNFSTAAVNNSLSRSATCNLPAGALFVRQLYPSASMMDGVLRTSWKGASPPGVSPSTRCSSRPTQRRAAPPALASASLTRTARQANQPTMIEQSDSAVLTLILIEIVLFRVSNSASAVFMLGARHPLRPACRRDVALEDFLKSSVSVGGDESQLSMVGSISEAKYELSFHDSYKKKLRDFEISNPVGCYAKLPQNPTITQIKQGKAKVRIRARLRNAPSTVDPAPAGTLLIETKEKFIAPGELDFKARVSDRRHSSWALPATAARVRDLLPRVALVPANAARFASRYNT
ncbi:hypothetical protein MSG28_003362 [Choristoneura fumiferana]|uniref:Uncharacterized protein n=1 Tax=Choristoneura fumiferana TaxID=7141 RepID=A0ACC0KED8_CHOFU|nr:hypothetical protein MSG28_003362 [Choristoneura fumiferana]